MAEGKKPKVALFVTCLVDMFRPTIGFATVKLLEDAGYEVVAPRNQTCCGQPAYNSGDRETAKGIARRTIETFEGHDYVVGPSGSCMATIKKDYPAMFEDDAEWGPRARLLSAQTFEIVSFLADVAGYSPKAAFDGVATYHDSCSGLRSLGVQDQPRALLAGVEGLTVAEMKNSDVCCGFGGTFCVKYPDISNKMVGDKTASITETGADILLAGDLGCLMNMQGKLLREGKAVKARHVVEVLAGMTDGPAIGEGEA